MYLLHATAGEFERPELQRATQTGGLQPSGSTYSGPASLYRSEPITIHDFP